MKTTNCKSDHQTSLFEIEPVFEFGPVAARRAHYGNLMESVVCHFLKIQPLPIFSSKKINLDARSVTGDRLYEIKSVRRSSKVPLYDWRMKKEKEVNGLFYVFAIHSINQATNATEWFNQIEDTGIRLIEVPTSEVHRMAEGLPLQINRSSVKCGYNREGYKEGYRNLPVKEILHRAVSTILPEFCDIYNRMIPVERMVFNKK